MKRLVMSLSLIFLTSNAFAGIASCSGIYQGKRVVLHGLMENTLNDASGSVSVDGRVVANFDGPDVKVNYIFLSFKVANAQGDYAEGKLTNIGQKSGILTRLSVPAYGIEYRNIPMNCWTK